MQAHHPACPTCHDNLFVRAERVLSGRRETLAYYCGRCNFEWQERVLYTPERRQAERRRTARATLRGSAERQKVG